MWWQNQRDPRLSKSVSELESFKRIVAHWNKFLSWLAILRRAAIPRVRARVNPKTIPPQRPRMTAFGMATFWNGESEPYYALQRI